MSNFTSDLTQGSVAKQLIKFSWPFLVSSLLQAVYSLIDMLIVGKFISEVGICSVQVASQITLLIVNLVVGFSVGGTVLISQNIGANRLKDVKDTIGTMLSIYFIAALFITAVMLLINKQILQLMNTPQESFKDALDFLNISMAGTVFIFGYNAISSILRALGDSKRPLYFIAISCFINIVLDLIFVNGFHLGVGSTALATVISQAVSFILAIIYLYKMEFVFDFKLKSFRIYGDIVKNLFKIGIPSTIQQTVINFSFLALTSLANDISGVIGGNAIAIGSRINSFAILPGLAMYAAITSMTGQNLGAGNTERAKKIMKTGIVITFSFSLFIFTLIQLFPTTLISAFLPDGIKDEALISTAVVYLRCMCFDSLVVSSAFCINGLIVGSGNTWFTLFSAVVASIFIRIPLSLFLSKTMGLGMMGIGIAIAVAPSASLIAGLVFYKSGRWKIQKVIRTKT